MVVQNKLRGTVSPGMFPNELTFVITAHDGRRFVVLVPTEFVEENHGVYSIDVQVVDRQDGLALVRVPGEPLDSSTVFVPASELLPA